MEQKFPNPSSSPVVAVGRPWKILIVDDDEAVQQAARAALSGLVFKGLRLQLLQAQSIAQAQEILRSEPGVAVAVVEVEVEVQPGGEGAGLDLVRYIRETLADEQMRIILRTGRPELTIERPVFEKYEINDYRTKAELTPDRLRGVVIEALRSYDSILSVHAGHLDLADTMESVVALFELTSSRDFYVDMLAQLNRLVRMGPDSLLCTSDNPEEPEAALTIRAATGRFAAFIGESLERIGESGLVDCVRIVAATGAVIQVPGQCLFRVVGHDGLVMATYVEGDAARPPVDWSVLGIFRTKAASVWNNLRLVDELNAVQVATVQAFARVAAYKDHDSDGHLGRIKRLSGEIAGELLRRGACPGEMDEILAEKIGVASILHDVSMFSIPEEILASTDRLIEEDFRIIAQHTMVGYKILSEAAAPLGGRNFLSIAAEICRYHHERYDGSGYPARVVGRAIPLSARIVAVADVFDALISERVHRAARPVSQAVALIIEQAGKEFDPEVVAGFEAVVARLIAKEPQWFPVASTADSGGGMPGLWGVFCGLVRRFRTPSA
jgi:response regulator RpfG family c-di-GMP phosphodiesterase